MRATLSYVVTAVIGLLALSSAVANAASLPWAYCGSPAPNTNTTLANQVLCPSAWSSAYPSCSSSSGVQGPVNFAGNIPVDSTLRPLILNWFPSRSFTMEVTSNGELLVKPRDVNPSLWDPNDGIPYALRYLRFLTPSEHSVAGARHDMEIQFVHTNRETDSLAAGVKTMIISTLYDTSSTRENDPMRPTLWPIFVQAMTSVNASEVHHQVADYSHIVPDNRNYVRYVASYPAPPCTAGVVYYVMEQVSSVSFPGFARLRAALKLSAPQSSYSGDSIPGRPIDGNARAATRGNKWSNPSEAPRRFVDFVGDRWYDAEPTSASLNDSVETMGIAALVMSCLAFAIALCAARVAQA